MPAPLHSGRVRAKAFVVLATVGALTVATVLSSGMGQAATSSTVVGAEVLGATDLDVTGCPPLDATRTSLGTLSAGAEDVTDDDCDVLFGSSNTTATLRTYRASPRATAMMSPPTVVTEASSSGRIMDIDMIDATNGWATQADLADRVLQTTDGGITWNSNAAANTAIGGNASSLAAPTTSDIWINRYSQRRVIRSADGGASWFTKNLPHATARAEAMWAADGLTAWAAGSIELTPGVKLARLWRTVDGGDTWVEQLTDADTSSRFTDVTFATGTTRGYATTQGGEIFSTADGVNWSLQTSTGNKLYAIDAIDVNRAIAVGSRGQVRQTSNGGTTWNTRDVEDQVDLRTIAYRSSGIAWASGEFGIILRSTDHGVSWTTVPSRIESGTVNALQSMSDTGIVTGSYGSSIARTPDTGATWTRSVAPGPGTNWTAIDGIDGASAIRVGSGGAAAYTTDGTIWTDGATGTSNGLFDIVMIDRTRAIAVGANGVIRRTIDGGASWTAVASGTTAALRAAATNQSEHVWIVGDDGTILRSTNAGASFLPVTSGTTARFVSVASPDPSTVLAGTTSALVRRTQNAGQTWSTTASPVAIHAITSLSTAPVSATPGAMVVWAAQGSYVARSMTLGTSWVTVHDFGAGQMARAVDAVDEADAWMSGHFGAVRRTSTGGATWSSIPGLTGTRNPTDVLALGPDNVSIVAEASTTGAVTPGSGPPDYGDPGATWAGAAGLFGICLRAAPGAGSTWPTTGSCTTSDGTNWRGLPDHGGAPEAASASTLAPGTTTASFRFGMKVAGTLPFGTYRAPLTFEVVASGS